MNTTRSPRFISRRQALANLTSGYSTLALASLLHEPSAAAPNVQGGDPLAPRRGHHAARAKRVITDPSPSDTPLQRRMSWAVIGGGISMMVA